MMYFFKNIPAKLAIQEILSKLSVKDAMKCLQVNKPINQLGKASFFWSQMLKTHFFEEFKQWNEKYKNQNTIDYKAIFRYLYCSARPYPYAMIKIPHRTYAFLTEPEINPENFFRELEVAIVKLMESYSSCKEKGKNQDSHSIAMVKDELDLKKLAYHRGNWASDLRDKDFTVRFACDSLIELNIDEFTSENIDVKNVFYPTGNFSIKNIVSIRIFNGENEEYIDNPFFCPAQQYKLPSELTYILDPGFRS